MVLIKWRESYSVGVAQFDMEHKVLVDLINDMYSIVRHHDDNLTPEHEIAELIKYTQAHFRGEEETLEKCGYPLLDEHKKIHAKLEQEVLEFKEQIEKCNDTLGRCSEKVISKLYLFLRDWLINHILEEDMKYKDCVNSYEGK